MIYYHQYHQHQYVSISNVTMTNSLSTLVYYIIGGVCGGIILILLIVILILTLLICVVKYKKRKIGEASSASPKTGNEVRPVLVYYHYIIFSLDRHKRVTVIL